MVILLIEDDFSWQTNIRLILKEINLIDNLIIASTIEEGIKIYSEFKPNLIIADLMFNGESILSSINCWNENKTPTIFITSSQSDQDFIKANLTENSGYLVKPFHNYTFISFLQSFILKHKIGAEESITVKGKHNEMISVPISKIILLQQDKNYCEIVTQNKKFIQKKSLSILKQHLNTNFLQINRSTIINIKYVTKFNNLDLIEINGTNYTVGRVFKQELAIALGKIQSIAL